MFNIEISAKAGIDISMNIFILRRKYKPFFAKKNLGFQQNTTDFIFISMLNGYIILHRQYLNTVIFEFEVLGPNLNCLRQCRGIKHIT